MEYIALGKTGLKVSVMGLGCGGFSRIGAGTGKTEAESVEIVRMALDAGINFIDTAEVYGTEGIVGKGIKSSQRDKIVISTKKNTWTEITTADVRKSLEDSLKRLNTDYVDIYHLHGVSLEKYEKLLPDILPEMLKLREEGKIRFIGITEAFGPDPGHEMFKRALKDDLWDVIMVGFNILNQSAREIVFPATIEKNIGVLNMFAIRNALSKPERLKEVIGELIDKGQLDKNEIDPDNPLGFLVHENGAESIPDAAYRFCRFEPGNHVILSGTGNPEHLKENIKSLARPPLPEGDVDRLKRIFRKVNSVAGN